jgi:hypothetical protein
MVAPLLTVAAQAADLPNFRRITKLIAIGGPPTDDGINVLYNEHFSTVIDLRDVSDRTSQEGARVERMGKISVQVPFKYVNIPLGGSTPADKTDWIPMFYIHAGSKDLNLPTTMVAIWRIYHDAWDYDKAFSEMTSTGFNIKSPGASELIDFVKSYAEAHKP